MNPDGHAAPVRLLLVEDDAESGQALKVMLEKRGVGVVLLPSAEEAMDCFSTDEFDIIVADIRLYGMSGVELLHRIREKSPDFPVILLTGYDSLESAMQAVRLGAQDYILKPLDAIEDLLLPVQKAVGSHRLLLQNRTLQEELRQSEARFRMVLENSVDIAFRLDLKTHTLDYLSPSARAILGCPGEDLSPPHISQFVDLVHPDERVEVEDLVRSPGRRTERDVDDRRPVECRVRRSGGDYCWLSITFRILRDADGNGVAVVGNARDITERRAAEAHEREVQERMARSKRMEDIGLMASGIAHDLNNVFFTMLNLPDLIRGELEKTGRLAGADHIRSQLMSMEASTRRASKIFDDLLTLSRSGAQALEPTDLNEVVEEYLDSSDFEVLARTNTRIATSRRSAPDVRIVQGSKTGLARVLMNLVRNACEAMPDGGSLTICTRNQTVEARILGYEIIEPGDYAVMEVTDTGSGISQEHFGKIFDPFFSSKQPGKRSGSGLGLTVVHRVVKDHHGFMDVQSRPGTGTTFALYFPISKEVVKEGARALPGTGKREVLVVDDAEDHLMAARDKLRQLGFDVVTASSGRRAVDVFHERLSGETAAPGGPPFDLVLMDMVLEQGFDGLDAYRAIAQTCPAQRCVIMSGFVPSERVAEARKLGVRGFVRKPYSLDALRQAVQTGLAG